eukprot:gene12296-5879_t
MFVKFSTKLKISQKLSYSGFRNKTPITQELWERRIKENQTRNEKEAKEAPNFLISKHPKESQQTIELPFSSNKELFKQYTNPYGQVQLGLIFEDMDAMAGNVAFLHADDNNPKTRPLKIVTASVDKIKLLDSVKEALKMQDLKMVGSVSWVGRSSLEIEVDLLIKCQETQKYQKLIESTFCMVAINDLTNKSAQINPLIPETEEEKLLFQKGEENKIRRSNERKQSLLTQPPTEEERKILHELFMKPQSMNSSANIIPMKSTNYQTLQLCQPTMKNLHNTIFGGYIMRKAYLLAFSTCFMFFKECPQFVSLDEITFVKPVYVGDFLNLNAAVVFTKENFAHIEVVATVIDPTSQISKTTNVFNFKFKSSSKCIEIVPETYVEGIRYLSARRQHFEE